MGRESPTLRVWTDPRLLAYGALTLLLSPVLLIFKLRRRYLQHYPWELAVRRWTVREISPDVPRADLVFVGAGPGELVMIDRIADSLRERQPELRVGVCLRNLHALDKLRVERPSTRLSVWPFDALPPVAKWLEQERPRLLVFVDRFRFPLFACGAARAGATLVLVNGRSRRRKGLGYRLGAAFYRWQFGGFRLMSMQSDANAEAARDFAPAGCRVISPGSLKADLVPRDMDEEQRNALRSWLLPDGLPMVAAGSTTGPLDDTLVIEAYLIVRRETPCRLLIAPRDPKREPELLARLQEHGLSVSRRSAGDGPADVLLLNTFGELATAYGFARAAYVGGFLGKGGGHNVLEPAVHGVPVAYGPNRGHFEAEQRLLESKGAGTKVDSAAKLAAFWKRFLVDEAERERVGDLGKAVLAESRGAVDRTAEAILELLELRAHEPGVL